MLLILERERERNDRITHTTAFVTPVVEHWLEREIAQWVHPTKDRSCYLSLHFHTHIMNEYLNKVSCFSFQVLQRVYRGGPGGRPGSQLQQHVHHRAHVAELHHVAAHDARARHSAARPAHHDAQARWHGDSPGVRVAFRGPRG